MTSDVSPKTMDRVLSYLDDLYAATESDQPFGEFIRASDLFFFSQSDHQHALLADTPASLDALNGFRQHVERIEKLTKRHDGSDDTGGDIDSPLACFVINVETRQVDGNTAAAHLMDCTFPRDLNDLPLTDACANAVKSLIHAARDGAFQGAQILPLGFEHREDVLVTRCVKTDGFSTHDDDALTLQFTASFVVWTKEVLSFSADEFGLTKAEIDVLQALLSGGSQTEAADQLGKSRETVKAQAKSILRKFGVTQMADVQNIARAYAFLGQRRRVDRVRAPELRGGTLSGSRMIDVGQLRSVEVWEYGARDGFPVLFWHGLMLGPFFTPDMIEAFRAAGLRIISISRPGFGRSSPPTRWEEFNDTVTADTLSVVDQLALGPMAFWVHQAGISFACRAAAVLKGRVLGAAMNGAGIPIKPHMLSKMNMTTRVAAATVLYAPKLMEVMLRHAFKSWRVKGPKQFYRQFFGTNGVEQETLKDPAFAQLFELGFLHTSAQVPEAMIWDGKSAMSDWFEEYAHFDFPQHWMHGNEDQVLDAGFVSEFLIEQGQNPLIVLDGYGTDLLYRGFEEVFSQTSEFFTQINPQG